MKKLPLLAILCAASLFISAPAPVSAKEQQCLDCHAKVQSGKVVHAALGMGCESCHTAPHAKKKPELSLMSEVPELCFNCHDKGAFTKKSQHTAVAGGMCTSCHNPHSGDNEKLLVTTPPELCYTCHDKQLFSKRVVHPPVKDGQCTFCHNPHSSDNAYNLSQPAADLCVMCHDKQASGRHVMAGFSAGDTHPVKGKPDPSKPGRELACTSCHAPHSSNMKFLFTNETASPDNLCLMCHKKIMLR